MPLPKDFKLHCVNELGFDIDASTNSGAEHLKVHARYYKFATDGSLVYSDTIATLALASDVADGGTAVIGAAFDNADTKWIGVHGFVELSSDDTGHDGTVSVYAEPSLDDGATFVSDLTEWDPEEDGIPLVTLPFTHGGAGTDTKGKPFSWEGEG